MNLGLTLLSVRKAHMHVIELESERDSLNGRIATVTNELEEVKREVALRRSLAEEKQLLENWLDEEIRAQERARVQLDSRMAELQKPKSKFVCL